MLIFSFLFTFFLLVDMIGIVSFNESAFAYNETLTKATTTNIELI